MRLPGIARVLCAAVLLASGGASHAHDTWFEVLPAVTHGETVLALGTGNRFPVPESAIDRKHFAKSGCQTGDGPASTLELQSYTAQTTRLRTSAARAETLTCFVQIDPFEIELPSEKIALYFKEIRPSATVIAAWDALRARGLPFRERFTKNARIDLGSNASSIRTGTTMDVVRTWPSDVLTVGSDAVFQVLRDGRPLADFPVELVNERSLVGLWFRTDAEGRIRAKLPLPGRWLLRGTDLRLSTTDPTLWESQFITYAFEVGR